MTPYAISLLESMFGVGCNPERALSELKTHGNHSLICGCCGERNFEWGNKGLITGQCRNCGTIHYHDNGDWKIVI